jgi:hypothetical protein
MSKRKSRRAVIVPERPIGGLYPTIKGTIYREKGLRWGQISEYFVPDDDQEIDEYDSPIYGYSEKK